MPSILGIPPPCGLTTEEKFILYPQECWLTGTAHAGVQDLRKGSLFKPSGMQVRS